MQAQTAPRASVLAANLSREYDTALLGVARSVKRCCQKGVSGNGTDNCCAKGSSIKGGDCHGPRTCKTLSPDVPNSRFACAVEQFVFDPLVQCMTSMSALTILQELSAVPKRGGAGD